MSMMMINDFNALQQSFQIMNKLEQIRREH